MFPSIDDLLSMCDALYKGGKLVSDIRLLMLQRFGPRNSDYIMERWLQKEQVCA
jgi:hypothetical protein